jgi:hypothetical protein
MKFNTYGAHQTHCEVSIPIKKQRIALDKIPTSGLAHAID